MPNNFHSPTHQTTIQLLQHNPTWQPLLKTLCYGILNEPEYKITWYYELLVNAGASQVQCWETDYFPELDNHQAIFEPVAGTALRPVLTAMDANNKTLFRDAYIQAISKKYPIQSNGKILLPYKRLFLVGFKN